MCRHKLSIFQECSYNMPWDGLVERFEAMFKTLDRNNDGIVNVSEAAFGISSVFTHKNNSFYTFLLFSLD